MSKEGAAEVAWTVVSLLNKLDKLNLPEPPVMRMLSAILSKTCGDILKL